MQALPQSARTTGIFGVFLVQGLEQFDGGIGGVFVAKCTQVAERFSELRAKGFVFGVGGEGLFEARPLSLFRGEFGGRGWHDGIPGAKPQGRAQGQET